MSSSSPRGLELTIFVPGLTGPWPAAVARRVLEGLHLPATTRLLTRANRQPLAGGGGDAWWAACMLFGMPAPALPAWPVAPITGLGDGGPCRDGWWMRADPVHLNVDFNGATVLDPRGMAITAAEAQALCAALNGHFQDRHLTFSPLHPHRWYVRSDNSLDLSAPAPGSPASRGMRGMPPLGEDGATWRAIATEAQMVLHDHAVNDGRRQTGQPAINTVWFWGAGKLPSAPTKRFDTVLSAEESIHALGKFCGTACLPLPARNDDLLGGETEGRVLVALGDLAGVAVAGEVERWREGVQGYEQTWFAPLLRAIHDRRLKRLRVVTERDGFSVGRSSLWKFWRGRGGIERLISSPKPDRMPE